MTRVKYDDLSAAFDFVSFAAPFVHRAWVALDTGAVYWVSEDGPMEEELPEDFETSDRYIELPHKNDLDLGAALVLRFAAKELPHRFDTIEAFFRRRGAYTRLKALLTSEGCLERWYAFESDATDRALRDWCAANEIQLDESDRR